MSDRDARLEELRGQLGQTILVYPIIEPDGTPYMMEVLIDAGIPYLNVRANEFVELTRLYPERIPALIEEIIEKAFDEELEDREEALADKQNARRAAPPPPPALNRPGYIYLLKAEIGMYKIGRTKHLNKRFPEFNTFLPFQVSLEHSFWAADYVAAEKFLHWCFAEKRGRGEWFALTPEDVEWFCNLTNGSVDGLEICSPEELGTYSPDEQGSDK